jgi:hypothetical protein
VDAKHLDLVLDPEHPERAVAIIRFDPAAADDR